MKKKNEIKDELNKLSPFLSDIKKKDSFKVPKNYFNSLPDKILEQVLVTTENPEKSIAQPNWLDSLIENIAVLFQPRYAVGLATVMILVIAAVYFSQKTVSPIEESYQLASQYIEENIDEFDAEMLWEASVFESGEVTDDETIEDVYLDEYFEEIIDDLDDSELEELL